RPPSPTRARNLRALARVSLAGSVEIATAGTGVLRSSSAPFNCWASTSHWRQCVCTRATTLTWPPRLVLLSGVPSWSRSANLAAPRCAFVGVAIPWPGWNRGATLSEVKADHLYGVFQLASGSELIRRIKEQIHEVDPREVHDASLNGNGRAPLLVDVREQHEF